MADTLGTSVSVSTGSDDVHYLPGHPRHDAVRFDVDSSNTTADDVTVEFRTYSDNDVRDAKDNGDFSSMDEVATYSNVDPSSGDPHYGVSGLSRVVAVKVNDNTGTGADGVAGTLVLHDSSDPENSAQGFLDRNERHASADSLYVNGNLRVPDTNREELSGDKTIGYGDPMIHNLDPAGARNVDLPPEQDGLFYVIGNRADAAEDITVRNDNGDTIATVSQDDVGYFISDGTGWVGFAAAGGAT